MARMTIAAPLILPVNILMATVIPKMIATKASSVGQTTVRAQDLMTQTIVVILVRWIFKVFLDI